MSFPLRVLSPRPAQRSPSTVKENSVIAVQIFDQRKFKKRDQGFLGVVNVKVSDVIDLELGGHGTSSISTSEPICPGPRCQNAVRFILPECYLVHQFNQRRRAARGLLWPFC